ncbi:hypothetical protein B9Z55_022120 [Caenorhabditis nigoni]|uniref:Uncharacterized protein n=2 Tax=Caenorhabditis nigoni TaxID=1611254 RepID=A0A2G5TVG9_9PELO|nr:hypothetical protein B9Z55_022120 [Caenorhabditis nigoni]
MFDFVFSSFPYFVEYHAKIELLTDMSLFTGRDDHSFRRYHHSGDTHHRSHSEYNQDQGSKRSHHVKSSRYDNSGSGRDDRSLRRYYRSGDTYQNDRSRIRSEIHLFENQERRTSDARDRRPKRDDSKTPDRSSNQKDFRRMSGRPSDSEYDQEQDSRRSQRAEKSNRSQSGRRSVEMQRQDAYDNFVGESRSPDINHIYLRRRNESEGSGGNRPTRGDAPSERMSRKDIFQEEIVSRFVLANGANIDWWAANPKCVEDDEEVVDVRKFNQANFEMVEQDVWDDILDYYDVKIFRLDQSSQLEISGKLKNVEDAWKDVDKTMLDIFYKKTTKEDGLFDFEFHVPAKFRAKLENREWTILLMNGDLFDVRQCVREDYSDENECFQLNGPVLHLEKLRNELLERLEGLEDEIPLRIQLGNNVIHVLLLNFAEKLYELEKRTNTHVRFHKLRQEWETVYVYIFGKRNDIKACRDELTALDAELRGE